MSENNNPSWNEMAQLVLHELERLQSNNDNTNERFERAVEENRKEICKKLDKIKTDNNEAHRTLHKKLDDQQKFCANRPLQCGQNFLPSRTFNWLLIVLIVLFGASFSLSGTALKHNAEHKVAHAVLEKKVDEHLIDVSDERIHDIEDAHDMLKDQVKDLQPK